MKEQYEHVGKGNDMYKNNIFKKCKKMQKEI